MSAELRALLAGASPAPWEWLDGGNGEEGDELQDGQGEQVASGFRDDINLDAPRGAAPPPGHITDGRLCAAMRNEIEALLDERDAAIRRAASLDAARLAMEDRYHDLAWCNKDDDCQTKAEGARLAIEDFAVAAYRLARFLTAVLAGCVLLAIPTVLFVLGKPSPVAGLLVLVAIDILLPASVVTAGYLYWLRHRP